MTMVVHVEQPYSSLTMVYHGLIMLSMVFHGCPWLTIVVYGLPLFDYD